MAEDSDIEIMHVKDWPADELVSLYRAGSWWKDEYDRSGLSGLVKGSFDFVVAYSKTEKRAVGMGRLISDGTSDGYIQDLVVFHDRRGEGIGGMIVKELVRNALDKELVWIGLIAEEGSEDFYAGLGFRPFKGRPMLYHGRGG